MRILLSSLVISSLFAFAHASATVSVAAGTIQGGSCTNGKANYFLRLPFAQPPIKNLRFASPQPLPANFTIGTYNATAPGPACIQFGNSFLENGATSEDCLYLDVWAPVSATTGSKLPVKVWIYGGGEQAGGISDPLYNGCSIAAQDSILVSINYRLGPLGFLSLDSAGIAGNFGIEDILLGLQWIQNNIASFGGDPKKVVLFGQSAGATNVFIISTLPQAKTLISSVISESGAGRNLNTHAGVQAIGESFAKSVNCSTSDAACLRSLSTAALNSSTPQQPGIIIYSRLNPVDFQPNFDGRIIPAQPSTVGTQVPTIYGSNNNEGTIFVLGQFFTPALNSTQYDTFLTDNFGPSASLVNQTYPLSKFNNTQFPIFSAMSTIITDVSYFCPAKRALDLAARNGVIAYTYLYNHTASCGWLNTLPAAANFLVQATHTAEIPFVFGNLDTALTLINSTCNGTSQEYALSSTVIHAWTAMAASGNPSIVGLDWPAWNASNSLGVVMNNATQVKKVDYSACEFWDELNTNVLSFTTANSTANSTGTSSASAPSSTSTSKSAGMKTVSLENRLAVTGMLFLGILIFSI